MRLDKYLKASRLIKRRTVAKEVCDAGRISVNDRVAKAGTELRIGDVLTIRYGQRTLEVRVLQLIDNPRKESAADLYEILGDSSAGTAGATDDKREVSLDD